MSAERPRIALGRIAGAHGIKGDVLIETYTADPRAIASYGLVTNSEGTRSFALSIRRETEKGVVGHIAGIDDRAAAEALKGVTLSVDRDRLPEPEEGAYYHADLVGLAAVDPDGKPVGAVIAVRNYGAGDLIELAITGAAQTELIPFTAEFVPTVDLKDGKIIVRLPA